MIISIICETVRCCKAASQGFFREIWNLPCIFPYKGASIYISDFSVLSYMTIESRSVFSACFVKIETRKVIEKGCDTKPNMKSQQNRA